MVDHPKIQEIVTERAEIDASIASLRTAAAAAWAEYSERVETWKAERDAAIADGRIPKSQPEPPDTRELDRELHCLRVRRERLAEREVRVLAEILPDLEVEAEAAIAELIEAGRGPVAALLRVGTEVTRLLRGLHEARSAADTLASRHGLSRTQARSHPVPVSLEDVLRMISGDVDVLRVKPMPGRPDTEPNIDRSDRAEEVVLGMHHNLGTPPPMPPRTRPSLRDRFT